MSLIKVAVAKWRSLSDEIKRKIKYPPMDNLTLGKSEVVTRALRMNNNDMTHPLVRKALEYSSDNIRQIRDLNKEYTRNWPSSTKAFSKYRRSK